MPEKAMSEIKFHLQWSKNCKFCARLSDNVHFSIIAIILTEIGKNNQRTANPLTETP